MTPRRQRIVLLIGIVFVAIGAFGVIASWGAYFTDSAIAEKGQRAEGQILAKGIVASADGDSDFTVRYSFPLPGGQPREAEHSVSKKIWDKLQEGGPVIVLYAPDHPERNFPLGGGVTSLGVTLFVSLLAAVFAVFGALLLISRSRTHPTVARS